MYFRVCFDTCSKPDNIINLCCINLLTFFLNKSCLIQKHAAAARLHNRCSLRAQWKSWILLIYSHTSQTAHPASSLHIFWNIMHECVLTHPGAVIDFSLSRDEVVSNTAARVSQRLLLVHVFYAQRRGCKWDAHQLMSCIASARLGDALKAQGSNSSSGVRVCHITRWQAEVKLYFQIFKLQRFSLVWNKDMHVFMSLNNLFRLWGSVFFMHVFSSK